MRENSLELTLGLLLDLDFLQLPKAFLKQLEWLDTHILLQT